MSIKPVFTKLLKFHFALLLLPATLLAADAPNIIPLWPNGAPGFEDRRNDPEQARDYWVRNINNPTLTVFLPPKEKANGAAVLICPGGGFRELVYNAEGVEPARYLNNLGVAAFVLKYRLPRETNSPYVLPDHPLQDVQRAMRIIRTRADEWNLDTNRIGAMGFSAGGEVLALLVYHPSAGNSDAVDPIDHMNCRADFQISIYPGGLGVPTNAVPADAPPAFFLVANDDNSHVAPVLAQLEKYRAAKRPLEVHILSEGGHGFNMGTHTKSAAVKDWPQLLTDWLSDRGLLNPPAGSNPGK